MKRSIGREIIMINPLNNFANQLSWNVRQTGSQPRSSTETALEPQITGRNQDVVEVSLEEKQRARKEALLQQQQDMDEQVKQLKEEMERAKEQAESMAKELKKKMTCMEIASRVMAGDDVPSEDLRYLAKHDTELYAQALSLRIARKDSRKYKRLSEDEEGAEEGATGRVTRDRTSAAPESGESAGGESSGGAVAGSEAASAGNAE